MLGCNSNRRKAPRDPLLPPLHFVITRPPPPSLSLLVSANIQLFACVTSVHYSASNVNRFNMLSGCNALTTHSNLVMYCIRYTFAHSHVSLTDTHSEIRMCSHTHTHSHSWILLRTQAQNTYAPAADDAKDTYAHNAWLVCIQIIST